MKIGIDIQTTLGQKTGFGFYVENLVRELKKIDRHNEYVYFAPKKERDLSMPGRFFWDQVGIPLSAARAKVDILHQPSFSLPLLFPGKVIATVHDLIAILFQKDIPYFSRQFFGSWMPFTYRKAVHIIAISEHTKKDLVRILKIPADKISVIYLAASDEFRPAKGKPSPPHRLRRPLISPYFLHVGTLSPRKNLTFLVEVFSEVIKKHPGFQLVFTGKEGWYYDQVFERVRELGLTQQVVFAGYLTDKEKVELYQAAFGFLFPSVYEGFGLPPLEAMRCGVPVVSSNASSMPEVVGEAGILLAPQDKAGWIKAVSRLIESHSLRQNLIVAGFKQGQQFSWRQNAEQTLELYQKIYEGGDK